MRRLPPPALRFQSVCLHHGNEVRSQMEPRCSCSLTTTVRVNVILVKCCTVSGICLAPPPLPLEVVPFLHRKKKKVKDCLFIHFPPPSQFRFSATENYFKVFLQTDPLAPPEVFYGPVSPVNPKRRGRISPGCGCGNPVFRFIPIGVEEGFDGFGNICLLPMNLDI